MWTHTEPPLAIGRGLLITTGAIGGLLSLAVLWAMLPSAGRGGIAVADRRHQHCQRPLGADRHSPPRHAWWRRRSCRFLPTTTAVSIVPVTTPVSQPAPSTSVAQPSTTVTQRTDEFDPAPVAVGVGDSLVITTARAVEGRSIDHHHRRRRPTARRNRADGRSPGRPGGSVGRCGDTHQVVRHRSRRRRQEMRSRCSEPRRSPPTCA